MRPQDVCCRRAFGRRGWRIDRRWWRVLTAAVLLAASAYLLTGCAAVPGFMGGVGGGKVVVKDQQGGTWALAYDAPHTFGELVETWLKVGGVALFCGGLLVAGYVWTHERGKKKGSAK